VDGQNSLNNQLIIISKDGKVEHKISGHLRTVRETILSEKNPLDWISIATSKTLEKVLNTIAEIDNVSVISAQRACDLQFPPGHPQERLVYAKHPAKQTMYFPLAGFHKFAFEHKFAEAIRLLAALGASSIRAEHVKGLGREFAANLGGTFAATGESATMEAGHTRNDNSRLLFTSTLEGHASPTIPDDLVWYPFEPMWQAIANNRTKHGLKQFSLTLTYTEDFGINSGLKAQLSKASLEIDGNFEEHQSTVWTLSGDFV
jgi:NAD(P)-dependent dehydrogenase (short-subunit alcohol dehydrogenase family)